MHITLMTRAAQPTADILPGLALLAHDVRTVTPDPALLLDQGAGDAVLVDARLDLASARTLTRLLSRWIWYQIDGQARELGVVVDPARPLAPGGVERPG